MIDVALIGAGAMGALHAATIARHPRCRLTRVLDVHGEGAATLAARFDAAVGPPRREDLVIVATPASRHVEVLQSLGPRPVLVEKPLAPSRREAEALLDLADTLFVAQSERYGWEVPAGMPSRIEGVRIACSGTRGRDVDVIADLLVHDLDRVVGWFGLHPTVASVTTRDLQAAVSVELRHPAGSVMLTVDREGSVPRRSFVVDGRPVRRAPGPDALTRQLEAVLAALEGRQAPVVRVPEALEVLGLCDAVRAATRARR